LIAGMLLAVMGASQVSAGDLSATLDGKRIRLDRVASLQCHDFDYPIIRCFSTAEWIAADIDARLAAKDAAGARLLLAGYVTVYQDNFYGTPSISLSTDQASLSSLGWNDRISSFRSFGAVGEFREHSPAGGFTYGYGSSSQVTYVGDAYNDKFNAFYIN
jgi:hypothetical protein